MHVLAIDTSSAAVTAAVADVSEDGVEMLAQRVTIDGRAHAEVLTPSIEACLGQSGLTVGDLEAVVAGVGPGPFTGLRVGLVTAAVLGDTLGLPTYGVVLAGCDRAASHAGPAAGGRRCPPARGLLGPLRRPRSRGGTGREPARGGRHQRPRGHGRGGRAPVRRRASPAPARPGLPVAEWPGRPGRGSDPARCRLGGAHAALPAAESATRCRSEPGARANGGERCAS